MLVPMAKGALVVGSFPQEEAWRALNISSPQAERYLLPACLSSLLYGLARALEAGG